MPNASHGRVGKPKRPGGHGIDSSDSDVHGHGDHSEAGRDLKDAINSVNGKLDDAAEDKGRRPRRGKLREAQAPDDGDGQPEGRKGKSRDEGGTSAAGRRKGGRRNDGCQTSSGHGAAKSQLLAPTCIALKCHHGKHIRAEPSGSLKAASAVIGDSEKFTLFHHDDGFVSLQSHHGKYMTTESNGEVTASCDTVCESTKFELVRNDDDTVSFRSVRGYMAAERSVLKANRAMIGAWEKFQLKCRSAKPAKSNTETSELAGSSAADPIADSPLFDSFCELEAVLLAEESYAKSHTDKTAKLFEKRAHLRRSQGLELSFRNFCEEHAYTSAFRGCVSGWDVTSILAPGEDEVEGEVRQEVPDATIAGASGIEGAALNSASEPRFSWATILTSTGSPSHMARASTESSRLVRSADPRVYAAFGIPTASAAEADAAALARLRKLCQLPCCVAVGPAGLDFTALPEAGTPEGPNAGLRGAAIFARFGTYPPGPYDPKRDPDCLRWIASGSTLTAEAWMLKHGDRRLEEFQSACADYARRRRDAQVEVAATQAQLAKELGLPLIVQLPPDDEAERRMVELLVSVFGEGSSHRLLLSAFRGRPKCVVALLKLFPGLVVGFSGLVTHLKLKATLGEVAFDIPLDRFVLESLGPRFPPAVAGIGDARGSYSHPAHIEAVADELARVKQLCRDDVLQAAWANAQQLWSIRNCEAAKQDSADP